MFKAVFSILGFLIAVAVVSSLAKHHADAVGQIGHRAMSLLGLSDKNGAPAGARMPSPKQQEQAGPEKSVFSRADDAWRRSEERYKRTDP
jgi:hypothetical protein